MMTPSRDTAAGGNTPQGPPAGRKRRPSEISEGFLSSVRSRLEAGKPVRRNLPGWGRLHIDRQLPFLCLYRRPPQRDDGETHRLVLGEASYLMASGEARFRRQLEALVEAIAATLSKSFGAFLVLEISAWTEDAASPELAPHQPGFRIVETRGRRIRSTVEALESALARITIRGLKARLSVASRSNVSPRWLAPALAPARAAALGCHALGLEVRPIYRDPGTGQAFPMIRRELHRRLSRALRMAFFEYTRLQTTQRPRHYHALGRRRVVKAVWEVDRRLAEVSNAFDLLLFATPTNPEAAWKAFRRARFERAPEFFYRPRPIDPAILKRELFRIPIERIEDPALALLFREQQADLDRRLTLIGDRETPRFLYGSLQLFGGVEDWLLALARRLLQRIPARSREGSGGRMLGAEAFAALARKEVARLRESHPDIPTQVIVRDDVVGLLVSRGNLLVGESVQIPASRAEALIQHEIGTHVVTYLNGRAQPFRQLYIGLPEYEELQEGFAVLAEYLVGGLSRPRLRLLAARVLAVRALLDGASFVDVFHTLDRKHDFTQRSAFTVTMRVFRGGGLTKDAIYLRGLAKILDYLGSGRSLEPLLVGKIGTRHVEVVQELTWRGILTAPPFRPRYLDDPRASTKLDRLRRGATVLDLVRSGRG